jgi:hypothetical protein
MINSRPLEAEIEQQQVWHREFKEIWEAGPAQSGLYRLMDKQHRAAAEHFAWKVFERTKEKQDEEKVMGQAENDES